MQNLTRFFVLIFAAYGLLLTACAKSPDQAEKPAFKVEQESPEAAAAAARQAEAKTASNGEPGKKFKIFRVYTDANSPDNHYAPSGWMGDWGDIKINPAHMDNPHAGTTSFKVTYTAQKTQGANWAGIYWQNPPNNWGGAKGGFDITGAAKLTFWVRGETGGEKIEEFRVGGISGDNPDSDVASIGPLVLTQEWKMYEIDLSGKDLTSISGGFMWSANTEGNPQGFTIYFDDIRYE